MPIPLWGALAYGGTLYQLDDPSVGGDQYDTDLGTYNAYVATLVTTPFGGGEGTFSKLRRSVLNVDTPATVNVIVQPMRDRQEVGAAITRQVLANEARPTVFPHAVSGSEFQLAITVSGWDPTVAPSTSLGRDDITLIPRRSVRGGNDT